MRGTFLKAAAGVLASVGLPLAGHEKPNEEIPKTRREVHRTGTGRYVGGSGGGGRPAESYHANGGGTKITRAEHRFDRKTWRSLHRQGERARAGRWPGVGDPNAAESWRKQEMALLATEKPKRRRKTVTAIADDLARDLPGGEVKPERSRIVDLKTS